MSTRSIVAVAAVGALAAAAAVIAVLTSDHITGELATLALALPTGLAYIASGLVARARRPRNGTGVLMILVGFGWFLAGFPSADHRVVFTAGLALTGIFIGFLAHLILAYPSGRLGSRLDRIVTAAMYALVSIVPLSVLLFDEGRISESACEGDAPCPENVLATFPAQPVANVLAAVYGIGAGALSIVVAVRLAQRWRRASPALRSALNPIVVTACVLIAAFAAQIAASFVSERLARGINWVVLVAMLALPLAFLYGLLRPRLTASARRLAAELSEQRRPEEVQAVLRRVLRDPTLELGYAAADGYVDVAGRGLELPTDGSGRDTTRIGDAVIVHDAALSDQPELDEVVDAARIAFERGLSLRSLEATERRTTALLDAIPDDMFRISRDGTFLDARVAEVERLPLPPDELIGRNIRDFMPPEIAANLLDEIRRACEQNTVQVFHYTFDDPTPDRGPSQLEARIVRSADDEVVVILRDITDIMRNEVALRRLVEEQAALARVAVAVATERDPQRVFDVVTEEAARVLGAEGANLIRFEGDAEGVALGQWRAPGAKSVPLGHRLVFDGPTPVALVQRTGRPARLAPGEPVSGNAGQRLRELGVESAVAAPVHVGGRLWGAFVVSARAPDAFPADAEERLENFAGLVAVAIANAEALEELSASRARIVRAGDEERRRLERNLHDGAQQRLVTLSLALRMVQAKLEQDPGAARSLLEDASGELAQALDDLRELASGLHPAILSDRGLRPALEALAARAPIPVELDGVASGRLPAAVEAAMYYVVAESLTNVAKYAGADAARVRVARRDGSAVVEVEDDGVGGADPSRGTGLRGLADRVEALDGRLSVSSEVGRGTLVRAEIPLVDVDA